jgi:hypothetical protein
MSEENVEKVREAWDAWTKAIPALCLSLILRSSTRTKCFPTMRVRPITGPEVCSERGLVGRNLGDLRDRPRVGA